MIYLVYMLLNRSLGNNYTMVVVSYSFIDGYTNYIKTFDGNWGKFITKSYAEGTNDIAVANYDAVNVLDASTGNVIQTFNASTEIINLYSYQELYLLNIFIIILLHLNI